MNCKVRQVPEEKLTDGDVSRRNSRIGRLSPICRQAVFACWPRELLPAALSNSRLPRRHVHLRCMPQIFSPRKRETAWASGPHISIPIPIYTSKEECWSPSSSQSQCWHCELQQRGPVQARRIEGEQLYAPPTSAPPPALCAAAALRVCRRTPRRRRAPQRRASVRPGSKVTLR